jgi:hypothetical protein
MLVSVFGDPSQESMFGLRAIQLLVENAVGSYHWVCEGTAAELAEALADATHKNIVFFADSPDHYIGKVFLEGNAPLVLLLHDPTSIVESLTFEREFDVITSIRVTSLSLSCLHDLVLYPRAYVISEPLNIGNIANHLIRIAQIYQIPINDVILKNTLDCLKTSERRKTCLDPFLSTTSISIRGFESLLNKSAVDRLRWPREVFMNADNQGAIIDAPIDLTGRARLLLYGPFLHLPRGSWIAEVSFEVRENFSRNVLKVDICLDEVAGEWTFQLPETGSYTFEIPLKVLEPRHPVQIRLYLMQGAIEGIFDLKDVKLRRAQ